MPEPLRAVDAGNPLQPKVLGYARFLDYDELELLTLRMIRFSESNSLQFVGLYADPGQPQPDDLWGFAGFSGLLYLMARFPTIKKVLISNLGQLTPTQYQAVRDVGGDVFVLSAVSNLTVGPDRVRLGLTNPGQVEVALRALTTLDPTASPLEGAAPRVTAADDVPSTASPSAPSIVRSEVTARPEGPELRASPSCTCSSLVEHSINRCQPPSRSTS